MNRAFSLIEMIVVIVVLGISFAILPTMMDIQNSSLKELKNEDGLFYGSLQMGVILSKSWDEQNVESFEEKGIYYAIHSNQSNESSNDLNCSSTTNLRAGHYEGKNRRKCENKEASSIGQDDAEFDDIDDFDSQIIRVEGFEIKSKVDYVSYKGSNPIYSKDDIALLQTSDIKRIKISIKKDSIKIADFIYYATNIGLQKPFIKEQ